MFAWDSATIPRWRVPPVRGPLGSRSSSLSVIITTDRPSYTVVSWRRPSFSGRRCPCLERTIYHVTSRHLYTVPEFSGNRLKTYLFSCFFPAVLWCLWSDLHHYRTLFTYFYLLTYFVDLGIGRPVYTRLSTVGDQAFPVAAAQFAGRSDLIKFPEIVIVFVKRPKCFGIFFILNLM